MGLFSRMSTIVKSKVSKMLDRAENPAETLDYSYEKQRELLTNVKRGLVEVTASRRRLELQAAKLREETAKLDDQARKALQAGREDLARQALQRKQTALVQLEGLDQQAVQLEQEQEKLTLAEQRLAAKVEAFRTQKEVIKANYKAAEAQVRIGEAVSGLSEEMTDIGMAIERAEDKTEQMRAKASAIDELVATGVLEDVTEGDALGRELQKVTAQQNVDIELESLRRELGAGAPAKQLEAGR